MNHIAAVIVTYNRLPFLKEIINALETQSQTIDKIFIVNNSSSDGTSEWLEEQSDLVVIFQDNIGSSGGQYTGIKAAYNAGYEYIWIMDDDVVPEPSCLENLIKYSSINTIITPLRYTPNGEPFINDTLELNLKNPFKSIFKRIITEKDIDNKLISAEGITFEGPLIHRNIIRKIGLPEKKFFIYADDTEYMIRALKAGFKIFISTEAKLHRKLVYTGFQNSFDWKTYYIIRNLIAIDILNGSLPIRVIRPFGYLISWLMRCNSFKEIKITINAFLDGYFYKSKNHKNER